MSSDTYQHMIVGKGKTVVSGKSHWKDFVTVHIEDQREAFRLAMNILRQIEHLQDHGRTAPIEFNLTGTLEPEEEG